MLCCYVLIDRLAASEGVPVAQSHGDHNFNLAHLIASSILCSALASAQQARVKILLCYCVDGRMAASSNETLAMVKGTPTAPIMHHSPPLAPWLQPGPPGTLILPADDFSSYDFSSEFYGSSASASVSALQ